MRYKITCVAFFYNCFTEQTQISGRKLTLHKSQLGKPIYEKNQYS